MARRSGLGRGIEALIPTVRIPEGVEFQEIPVADIEPNPRQPRTVFDEEALEALAASIAELGVLQPVLVRPAGDRFELVAGERRWRAAQRAGLASVPAIVRDVDDGTSLEQALVENLHREDLNPIEEAAAYELLATALDLTQEAVADRVGRSRPAVTNAIRLLQLPPEVQALLIEGSLSAGHGRALLALDSADEQRRFAEAAVSGEWTVRRLEREVRARREAETPGPPGRPAPSVDRPAALLEVEERLADRLQTRVQVELTRRRGRITIEFADLEDLGRVFALLDTGPSAEGR